MGQYYLICNLDKQQYLHPQHCGDGMKLTEFGCSGMGTLMALTMLLASGNGRGGGDLGSNNEIVGSWAGDRIVIAGDYDDPGLYGIPGADNLYHVAAETWVDVSYQAMHACCEDNGIREELAEPATQGYFLQQAWPSILEPPPLALPRPALVHRD